MAKPVIKPANLVIGVLAIAVIVLGYLYYQERRDRTEVRIEIPGLKIETD